VRPIDTIAEFSATLKGYFAAAGRIHFSTWSGGFWANPVDAFFPTFVVITLAGAAIVWAILPTKELPTDGGSSGNVSPIARRRVLMLVAIAAIGVILSLGTRTPVYGWLYQIFPPMQGLRASSRFGNLFLLGMAVLAAYGLAWLRPRLPARWAPAVVVALVVLANVEALRAPFQYTRFAGIPPIYGLLAEEPGRVVLVEVPFYPPQGVFENGTYVLNSTAHWRPLMNGYSGYTPGTYRKNAETFWYFPREHAIQAMRQAGATHVMIHPHAFGNEDEQAQMWKDVAASPYLERIATTPGGPALYRLK
jgi:hypothetical protein